MTARPIIRDGVEAQAKTIRCAIYTRKSSDEGLDQTFNSLDAQREACEAYIKSQAHEGWVAVSTLYDDGGFSGGSMERPALKALLADIALGKIDVVAVYKIDRLTRSLGDFGRIVEVFDKAGASFVSITQAFNTTTSMGRLTLNVLLSFAQFEREVTGERIRDKIAQSKAKGLWMGGVRPLGYDAKDQVLVVNEAEAVLVRRIFKRYLEVRSVHRLCDELEREGARSKVWTTRKGRSVGGAVITRGALYHLLQNRHYVGEVRHGPKSYPGQHRPIVDRAMFDEVADVLKDNRRRHSEPCKPSTATSRVHLTGRLFDAEGDVMSPTTSRSTNGRLYRYYVSSCLQSGVASADAPSLGPRRQPAEAVEAFVLEQLRRLSGQESASWQTLSPLLRRVDAKPATTEIVIDLAALAGRDHPKLAVNALCARLQTEEQVVEEHGDASAVRVSIPQRLEFRGGRRGSVTLERRLTGQNRVDADLVAALRRGHSVATSMGLSPLSSRIGSELTAPTDPYERMLCRLAFLAPDLQLAILEGRQPAGLSIRRLAIADLPLTWQAQRRWWRTL